MGLLGLPLLATGLAGTGMALDELCEFGSKLQEQHRKLRKRSLIKKLSAPELRMEPSEPLHFNLSNISDVESSEIDKVIPKIMEVREELISTGKYFHGETDADVKVFQNGIIIRYGEATSSRYEDPDLYTSIYLLDDGEVAVSKYYRGYESEDMMPEERKKELEAKLGQEYSPLGEEKVKDELKREVINEKIDALRKAKTELFVEKFISSKQDIVSKSPGGKTL